MQLVSGHYQKIWMLKITNVQFLRARICKRFSNLRILTEKLLSLSRISSLGHFQFTCSFNTCVGTVLNAKRTTATKAHRFLILTELTFCGGSRFKSFLKDDFREKAMKKTKHDDVFERTVKGGRAKREHLRWEAVVGGEGRRKKSAPHPPGTWEKGLRQRAHKKARRTNLTAWGMEWSLCLMLIKRKETGTKRGQRGEQGLHHVSISTMVWGLRSILYTLIKPCRILSEELTVSFIFWKVRFSYSLDNLLQRS